MDGNTINDVVDAFLIVASFLYLPAYGFTLVAICKSKELIKLSCYRIMVALGLCDIIQVIFVGLVPGFMGFVNFVPDGANKVMGAILIFGWYGTLTLAAILAVNRLVTVAMGSDAENMFSGMKVFIWIVLAVVYSLGHFVSYCCENVGMMYDVSTVHWTYLNTTESDDAKMILLASDSTLVSIMVLCYVSLGVFLKVRRKYSSSGHLTRNDIRALLSAFLVASSITVTEVWFYISGYYGPHIRGLGSCLWLISSGKL